MSRWRPTPLNCIYVIADIHGGLNLLKLICDRILPLRRSDGGKDHLVLLGDYIDRHIDSHLVLDFLIDLQKTYTDQITFLMGNHELMLLEALNLRPGVEVTPQRQQSNYQMWMTNGGLETLLGYLRRAGLEENPLEFPRNRISSIIPKEHIEFLQSLQKYHTIDNYVFVHGGLDPLESPANQDLEVLVWDRSLLKFVLQSLKLDQPLPWDVTVVTGHNVLAHKQPVITEKFLMLDCGSPKQLLVTELQSMESYMANPDYDRLVRYELKETIIKPIFRRVDKPIS